MARRIERGFSLVELLVAVAIGTAGIAVASYVARMAVRGASRGSQVSQAVLSTQVIARQLRADVELAGFGSTGAVGAAPGILGQIAPGPRPPGQGAGFNALPAVRGADNVAAGLAIRGGTVMPGSDVLQLIVPDPSRATVTSARIAAGANCGAVAASLVAAGNLGGCTLRYVSDHSGANGAGRTQLVRCVGAGDATLFDLGVGADVMCARWSTYWVDTQLALHRSDYDPAVGAVVVAGLPVPGGAAALDVIAPGVVDLQIAYRVSSVVPGANTAAGMWVNDGVSATALAGASWFEVRQVRSNVLFRSLRAVDDGANSAADVPTMENRAPNTLPAQLLALRPNGASRAYRFVRMSTSEVLKNPRFFDLNVPAGVPADPY